MDLGDNMDRNTDRADSTDLGVEVSCSSGRTGRVRRDRSLGPVQTSTRGGGSGVVRRGRIVLVLRAEGGRVHLDTGDRAWTSGPTPRTGSTRWNHPCGAADERCSWTATSQVIKSRIN